MTPAERAWAAWDHIVANPTGYDRLVARIANGHGTVTGYPGRVCLNAGDRPLYDGRQATCVQVEGRSSLIMSVRMRACELLGLPWTDRHRLLDEALGVDELRDEIEKTFGPHPGGVS